MGFSQSSQTNPQIAPKDNNNALSSIPAVITEKCKNFFLTCIDSKIDNAFKEILLNSPIIKKDEQLNNLIAGAKQAENLYGKMLDYEYVRSDIISNSLIRVLYFSLHNDFPLRWYYTFYKTPNRGWIIINLRFDDDSQMLFINE